MEIEEVVTLRDFLIATCKFEYSKQYSVENKEASMKEQVGKITFNEGYNHHTISVDNVIRIMLQDFEDGLFRVFINRVEYNQLDEKIDLKDQDECVFLRLVMLAGRLW